MKKIFASIALFLASCGLLSAPLALADNNYSSFDVSEILNINDGDTETNGQSIDLFENIIESAKEKNTSVAGAIILRAINLLSLLVGTFTFVVIMIGGLLMVTAGGDQNKIDRSKSILVQSILGLSLAFMAYFITAFIQSFFY